MAAPCRTVWLSLKARNKALTCAFSRKYTIMAPESIGPFKPALPWERKEAKKQIPGATKSLAEKLADIELASTDSVDVTVNIGVPYKMSKTKGLVNKESQERKKELERAARHGQLEVPLDAVREAWTGEYGPQHIRQIAEHYGIYRDLFFGAYFYPVISLKIAFDFEDDLVTPVFSGNKIPAAEAKTEPFVQYDASDDSLWTLLMTNPDSHLQDNDKEYIHWFVGNIPGSDVAKGEVCASYLPPFPPKGTGYHRHVFLLFKQSQKLNYSKERLASDCVSLKERTFRTEDFYREHEEHLTPMGLSFFQSEWDPSVTDIYHNVLHMREPTFEYCHPPPYHPPQKKYPHRQPFDRYYDRYRDKKDLAEEVLRHKLKLISPFKPYRPQYKYPLVHLGKPSRTNWKPSWLRAKEELMHRRVEQFKDLPK